VEFSLGVQSWFNIRIASVVIHHTKRMKKTYMTISPDAEKASDKIQLFMRNIQEISSS
jgi:aspartyl/asparaginyl-tRNA synthetase